MTGREFLAGVERVGAGIRVLRMMPAQPIAWTGDGDRRASPSIAAKPFRAGDFMRHVRAALALPARNVAERRAARIPA